MTEQERAALKTRLLDIISWGGSDAPDHLENECGFDDARPGETYADYLVRVAEDVILEDCARLADAFIVSETRKKEARGADIAERIAAAIRATKPGEQDPA